MAGTKLWIVSCFACFALVFGPIAWTFTQVKRVHLSFESIQSLEWNQSTFSRPLRHLIHIYSLDPSTLTDSKRLSISSDHIEYVLHPFPITDQQRIALKETTTPQMLDELLVQVAPSTGFSVFLLCQTTPKSTMNKGILTVGIFRHSWSQSACNVEDPLFLQAIQELAQDHVFPRLVEPSKDTKRARIAAKYRIQLSLLQEEPEIKRNEVLNPMERLKLLEQEFLQPLLSKLHSIASFTIEKEVFYYAQLAKEVHYHPTQEYYYIHANDLKQFKSTNDFLLSSVLSDREQVLHLSLFLPSSQHSPLYIQENQARACAFEIPSWGMVVIDNNQTKNTMAGLWITQLRTLLGLPSLMKHEKIAFLPSLHDGVTQWEVDRLVQELVRHHVKRTVETLQSIAALVQAIPELQAQERVQTHIDRALATILSIEQQSTTRTQEELLLEARDASDAAEAAYYDHTMIRQLYFPQQQMIGVYAPLLAPLLLPFFVGWRREWTKYQQKK